jgi:hypothetical protein
MITLSNLETVLRQECAYAKLAESHAHRATREDSLSLIKGRDAITAAWIAEDRHSVTIDADLVDMIAFTVDGAWKGHRWVWRDNSRIVREVLVEDRNLKHTALPLHPPLGELRAGRGQFSASERAILPPGFPEGAMPLANKLHRAWNGRAFDLYHADWLTQLVRDLPDATFQFEHALVNDDQIALLWRIFGHSITGRRIRLIGSSVFSDKDENTVFDQSALAAQKMQDHIYYAD